MHKIGLVGCGFVGNSVKKAYEYYGIEVLVYDPYIGYNIDFNLIKDCDAIFICVPSPTTEVGKCDTSILEEVLKQLKGSTAVVISKVTAPPSVYKVLQQKYINLVHSPEFLVAATAEQDYFNSTFAFIGGNKEYCKKAEYYIKLAQRKITETKFCAIEEASLAKYTINTFLATKVAYMNQIYELCKHMKIDYDNVKNLIVSDSRIGTSHLDVPGPDGLFGFGGACFPKDTKALVHESDVLNYGMSILSSVVLYNKQIREKLL